MENRPLGIEQSLGYVDLHQANVTALSAPLSRCFLVPVYKFLKLYVL